MFKFPHHFRYHQTIIVWQRNLVHVSVFSSFSQKDPNLSILQQVLTVSLLGVFFFFICSGYFSHFSQTFLENILYI